MRITYEGGWKGYVDLDEQKVVWTQAPPAYRGELPTGDSFFSGNVHVFLSEGIGIGDDFWDWAPDN